MFPKRKVPDQRCVLAIGAHPDDVVISVGGVLAQLSNFGLRVVILTLSSGERGGDPALRESEEQEAARRLGATAEFGRLPDGDIAVQPAIQIIDDVVARYCPATVFGHSAQDTHQDHIVAARATSVSCRKVPTLLSFEGPSSKAFEPTVVLDVTDAWEQKLLAVQAHASQLIRRRLMDWVDAVARYRSWPTNVGGVSEGLQLVRAGVLPAVWSALSARERDMAGAADPADGRDF